MSVETTQGTSGGRIIQFSVFLENKVGRLLDLVRLLDGAHVHLLALTVIDTADCAIDRFVADDPDLARDVMREHGFSFTETFVVAVEIGGADELREVLTCLLQAECNLHFTYPFLVRPRDKSCLVLHVEDDEVATGVLRASGFRVLTQRDISR
jgi:hypothetical protein